MTEPRQDRRAVAARTADLLRPLRERQRRWLRGELDDVPEDPQRVRAQPLVVRRERADPPARTPALQAAAAAVLAVLCDERAGPGGDWHDDCAAWVAGRIRKVARRARGAEWHVLADVPGVTVADGAAEVRAFPPYRLADTPRVIDRLPIGGTELPDVIRPGEPPAGRPVIWLAPGVPMTAGKAMAQVGHAGMLLAAYLDVPALAAWIAADLAITVRVAGAAAWSRATGGRADAEERFAETGQVLVRDAGFTEVERGTVTAVAGYPR